MALDKLNSVIARLFFAVAFLLMVLACAERVVNLAGYTIMRGTYTSGRLLEFAGILVVFVIALLLRQIREQLRKR